MDPVPVLPDTDLEMVRRQRAELRESLDALEQALAAPTPGRTAAWAERVHVALVELEADFRTHVQVTEGPDGLYTGVLATAPRLSHAVRRLTREHEDIRTAIDALLRRLEGSAGAGTRSDGMAPAEVADVIRARGTALLGRLIRHRQRGADLIYEVYQSDIGGET